MSPYALPHKTEERASGRESLLVFLPSGSSGSNQRLSADDFRLLTRYWYPTLEAMSARDISVVFTMSHDVEHDANAPFRVMCIRGRTLYLRNTPTGPRTLHVVSPAIVRQLGISEAATIMAVEFSMATAWAFIACKLYRKRFWIFQEAARERSWLKRQIGRFLASKADLVIANSQSAVDDVITNLGVSAASVVRVPILSAPPRSYMLAEDVPLPDNARGPIFLTVAQLIPRKNIHTLLKAASIVKRQGCTFTLWIVGTGTLRDELVVRCRELGIEDSTVFVGHVPYQGMGHLFEAADVYVQPTRFDYRSVSVLEAMRFGKPLILSTADGNAGELGIQDENALLFDPDRPEQLARLMMTLIREPQLRAAMGQRSLELIANETSEVAGDRIKEIIER